MKKVAFITRHAPSNYGSVLQAYATQKVLESLNCDARCIDYIRPDELSENIVNTHLSNSRWNRNPITRAVYRLTQKPVFELASKRFAGYRQRLLKMTERTYHTTGDLKSQLPEADIYMTGSDQVWNTVGTGEVDPAYFLSFVPQNARKVSFASSFGGSSIPEDKKESISQCLKAFHSVTVREESGIRIASELGVNARRILDPVFLLEPKQWEAIIPDRVKREKYVLVYQLHPNKAFQAYAKEFARRSGMKLIRINPYIHHALKPGKFVFCPSPEMFLWYIRNADCLLTDSFHGTAFAIHLNTPFIDILSDRFNERIRCILSVAGLEDRILSDYEDFSIGDRMIDFSAVNDRMRSERSRSVEVLKDLIMYE